MPGVRDLTTLPKVDLHVHLEGSILPATLVEVAARNGTTLPSGLTDGRYRFRDFPDFIAQWTAAMRCLRTAEDFRRIAFEFSRQQGSEGVRYAEPFFSLPEHGMNLGQWDSPLEAVVEGLEAGREFGVTCRVIVDVIRGIPMEASERGLAAALRFRDRGVVGIGLGGNERVPPAAYAALFDRARKEGLHTVAHAGEAAGPESIRAAIDVLGAERIGHGIRILEDPDLVAEVRERRIPLETCPTSNVMTGVVSSIEAHPLPVLLESGLRVTVNSDDPAMFASPLSGEYEIARRVFGLSDGVLAEIARTGVEASFGPERTKRALEADMDAWLEATAP